MNIKTALLFCGLFILLPLLFCACQSSSEKPPAEPDNRPTQGFDAKAPSWFKTGRAVEASDPFSIAGLGFSSPNQTRDVATDQARKAALEAIADQIETRINSEKTLITENLFLDGEYSDKDYFEGITKQWTDELLVGVVITREYYDAPTRTAGAVAVMDRQKFSKRMYQMAEEQHNAALGHIKAFEQAKAGGDTVQAIKELICAHGAMEEVGRFHSKVIAVGDEVTENQMRALNDPDVKERLSTELALSDDLKIEIISGDEQNANLEGTLPEPVVVKVKDSAGKSLSGLAMKIASPKKGEALPQTLATGTTGADGVVSFQVNQLKASGQHSNSLVISVAYETYAQKTMLNTPLHSITYLWPTREMTRIAVVMHETVDEKAVQSPFAASVLENSLAELNFQVVRLNMTIPPEEAVKMQPAALAEKLGDQCDYLLIGHADAFFSSEISNQVFYRTKGALDALELDTGKIFHLDIPFQATKAGTLASKRMQAAYQSLKNAGTLLTEKLSEQFLLRFEEGGAWDG